MIKKNLISLLIILVLGSWVFPGQVVPLPEIKKPENIIVDQNQILITEFPNVFIYSLEDYKLINKFGKKGEGPQEFSQYVRIQPYLDYPNYIVVGSHMKMSYFTRDGKFVKEVRSKTSSVANVYKPLGKKYVAYGFLQENNTAYNTINIFDADLKKIKEVVRWEAPFQQGKPFNPTDNDLAGGEFRVYANKIFFILREEGNIDVFDHNGEKIHSIKYNYERVPVTQEDKQEYRKFYQTDPRYRQFYNAAERFMKFPKYFPATREQVVADDKIYVLTHKKIEGKSEFVVFSIKGKFLKKIPVPFENANPRDSYPFTIKNQKLFQLIDNVNTEEWELHIHPIQ
ncbi:MAG: hypothetical protein JSV88_28515 [Candidatus Aminicenantes bacterium]|nr:MAG: hypothetical protein JSV88_28515 [Candidatus Aminicenantes bacterium]